jgi:hypothetical protein
MPFTSKVLQAKECTLIPSSFVVFTFEIIVESIKEFRGASTYAHGSSMHQKCFNYALINLLIGLYRSKWIIDPLITYLNPHPKSLI